MKRFGFGIMPTDRMLMCFLLVTCSLEASAKPVLEAGQREVQGISTPALRAATAKSTTGGRRLAWLVPEGAEAFIEEREWAVASGGRKFASKLNNELQHGNLVDLWRRGEADQQSKWRFELEGGTRSLTSLWSREPKATCMFLSFLLLGSMVFLGSLRATLGDSITVATSILFTTSVVLWLFHTGLFQKWWYGAHLGYGCQFLCWTALFLLCTATIACSCFCCCMGLFMTANLITPLALASIKNKAAKELRERFDKKEGTLSGPRRLYYQSQAFKDKCDRIFDKAFREERAAKQGLEKTPEQELRKDQASEKLRLQDLYLVTHEAFGGDIPEEYLEIFQLAFDDNAESEIDRIEYMEMCKFFSVSCLPDELRSRTISQHLETLSLPEDATLSEVKKQYHRLARQYHPDKRNDDASSEVVQSDMQEINEANAVLRKHFEAGQDCRDAWDAF